jgi:predicted acylesterase/phospholipase RssA
MARTKYSLLALDGGGIRGAMPARILQEIEERTGRPVCELFDLVAGTSTGGILALGLTKPAATGGGPAYAAADLLRLYVDRGAEIFPPSLVRKIRSLGGLADVRYPAGPIEALMRDRFGTTMLSEALVEVVIPSYDLSAPRPFFFKRSYSQERDSWNVEMWKAARATSAAPTYFEPAQLPAFEDEGDHALVDGGLFANNPTASAYADAVALWPGAVEIHVVSIGTGRPPAARRDRGAGIPVSYGHARHWGLARWAHPILDVVFDGVANAVEYQMERLCRHGDAGAPRYHRIQGPLQTAHHALDDASAENIARLLADTEAILRDPEVAASLDRICAMLGDVCADRDAEPAAAPVR